jgi:hypothetical protein
MNPVNPSAKLDRLRIATPCPIGWEQMDGSDRVRFCGHCQLNVYNLSALTQEEAETLLAASEGKICARLFRRADGTVITKDCPVGLRALRRRISQRAALVFATLAGISVAVFGQERSTQKSACTPQMKISRAQVPASAARIFAGTILDVNGAGVHGARVHAVNSATKDVQDTATNEQGKFEFASVAEGNYQLEIVAAGFKSFRADNVQIEAGKSINLDIILELAGGTAVVGLLSYGEPVRQPVISTITEPMIRRFPIQK